MSNGKQAIIFNGPPNSGKDIAAQVACRVLGANHIEFKSKLLEIAACLFNIELEEFMTLYNDRSTKELETCRLEGYSPRGAVMFVAEQVVKPNFGNDYFAYSAALQMRHGINVFSDGGFIEEVKEVYDECEGNLAIVQIQRPGYEYGADTRGYIDGYKDAQLYRLSNDDSLSIFVSRVSNTMQEIATNTQETQL